eukprot:scaffold40209_cov199-Amphora_coffeaeformis.AAC.2
MEAFRTKTSTQETQYNSSTGRVDGASFSHHDDGNPTTMRDSVGLAAVACPDAATTWGKTCWANRDGLGRDFWTASIFFGRRHECHAQVSPLGGNQYLENQSKLRKTRRPSRDSQIDRPTKGKFVDHEQEPFPTPIPKLPKNKRNPNTLLPEGNAVDHRAEAVEDDLTPGPSFRALPVVCYQLISTIDEELN